MSNIERFRCDRKDVIDKLNNQSSVTPSVIKETKRAYQKLLDEVEQWLINNINHPEFEVIALHAALIKTDIITESQKLINSTGGKNPWGKSEECMGISALPYKHSKES